VYDQREDGFGLCPAILNEGRLTTVRHRTRFDIVTIDDADVGIKEYIIYCQAPYRERVVGWFSYDGKPTPYNFPREFFLDDQELNSSGGTISTVPLYGIKQRKIYRFQVSHSPQDLKTD